MCWRIGFSCIFFWLLSIITIQLYRVLKDSLLLHVLLDSVKPINKIEPPADGQVSAAYTAGFRESYKYNLTVCWRAGLSWMFCWFLWFYQYYCTVCRRTGFSCIFCWLLSILSIKFYRLLKAEFSCMFCWLMSNIPITFYRVLKYSFQLHVLLFTVNPITSIVPCVEC